MRRSIPIVSGFVFLAFSVLALGQSTIYKLQQADGRTVYSDKKLPNTKVQKELKESDSELSTVAPLASGKQSQETDNRFIRRSPSATSCGVSETSRKRTSTWRAGRKPMARNRCPVSAPATQPGARG